MQIAKSPQDTSPNGQDAASMTGAEVAGVRASTPGEFHSFVADVEDLLKATTSLTGEDLARARARLHERIASAKLSLDNAGHAIAGGARRGVHATDHYVHQQPWQAIGIGALVGLTIGYLAGRRH